MRSMGCVVKRRAKTPESGYWNLLHGNKCFYCNETVESNSKEDDHRTIAKFRNFKTYDHIIPRSNGGKDSYKNLVVCCNKCNNERGDIDFIEFGIKSILNRKLKEA